MACTYAETTLVRCLLQLKAILPITLALAKNTALRIMQQSNYFPSCILHELAICQSKQGAVIHSVSPVIVGDGHPRVRW